MFVQNVIVFHLDVVHISISDTEKVIDIPRVMVVNIHSLNLATVVQLQSQF